MENQSELFQILKKSTLFYNIPDNQIAKYAGKVSLENYSASQVVFQEGTQGGSVYIIAAGSIKIFKKPKQRSESILGILHAGDFFGELELIDELPRSATAVALIDSRLIKIFKKDFQNILRDSPEAVPNILRTLTIRLRSINDVYIHELDKYSESTNSKMNKLHRLIEAAEIVNSTLDIDKLLKIILDIAVRTIKADRGTLYLIDENKKELWSKVLQGNELVDIRLPLGKGIAGKVAETGEIINIIDAYQDERFNSDIDKESGYNTKSILCMPMKNKDGKILGVFQLLNKKKDVFTKEDEEYVGAFSVHASIALENASLAQQMVQSERLSAVGRMASTIIHDIKNPMGTIRLYAQVLKTKAGNEEAAMMADEITRQIDRFVSMTQEILDFSKGVSVTNIEEVEIRNFIDSVLTFIEKDCIKRQIKLEKNTTYTGKFKLDPDKMMRVFYNIAGNAADAMPDGGNLKISTFKSDNMLKIEFTDTGKGMTDAIKSKIFEPFFTAGKKHGTGLGMAIVKKIVEDHQGKIEIESELGKGTTMRIELPF
jgi:K+-sensing histidine kinase KdpD